MKGRNFCCKCLYLEILNNGTSICTKFNLKNIDDRIKVCGGKLRESRVPKLKFKKEQACSYVTDSKSQLMMTREELYKYFETKKKLKSQLW